MVNLDYQNTNLSPLERAESLLSNMTLQEKIDQLRSVMLDSWEEYLDRDFTAGHVRNISAFLPLDKTDAETIAKLTNEDTRRGIESNRWGIPPLQNGEALHGSQNGKATIFPQAIGLAATFDENLIQEIGRVVAEELCAVGIRQVFAPVVNVARDCRWGRTEETYGESVLLNARLGTAYVRGLEQNGVIAAPKHFVDNYSAGGRDSNASLTSWRELREVYLEPFRECFSKGGARSVMAAYNSVDGVPCSCSRRLLQRLLREEWGFDGFVISDYGGVAGVWQRHRMQPDLMHAQAACINAGIDVDLPTGNTQLLQAVEQKLVSEETVDTAVLRVLKAKFELGLMDQPYVDPVEAGRIVLSAEHIALAEKAAEECTVLLKNRNHFLPLDRSRIKRIGVFGPAADIIAIGGYSGRPCGVQTPLEALRAYLGDDVEVLYHPEDTGVAAVAADCDVALYFAAILEGEGRDRCDIRLPDNAVAHYRDEDGGIIVGPEDLAVRVNQHQILNELKQSGTPTAVVLIAGAPVDTEDWGDWVDAILEAWYPGQMGGSVIARTLFGDCVPGGKLPICFPMNVGQVPLHHAAMPSGRGFGYIENDGKPRYPFGFGLSYTTFALSDASVDVSDRVKVTLSVTNTGERAGDEVVQLYIHQYYGSVVRPLREIKDFVRVHLQPGECRQITLSLDRHALSCCDEDGEWMLFDGCCDLLVGTSADDICFRFSLDRNSIRQLH